MNSWLIGKDPDAGKDWRHKEKKVTQDEMVGWHHGFIGHELGQTLGDGEGQRSLMCCSSWGYKELDMTYDWTTTGLKFLVDSVYLTKEKTTFIHIKWFASGQPLTGTTVEIKFHSTGPSQYLCYTAVPLHHSYLLVIS